jgi:hypothetical protein
MYDNSFLFHPTLLMGFFQKQDYRMFKEAIKPTSKYKKVPDPHRYKTVRVRHP